MPSEADRRSDLYGTVCDTNGSPQSGLKVVLLRAESSEVIDRVQTDEMGEYRFKALEAGRFHLHAAPGREQGTRLVGIDIDGIEDRQENVTVPAPAEKRYLIAQRRLLPPDENGDANLIFGRIVDESGEPRNGVRVRIRWTGADSETDFPTVESGQFADKGDGYYEFEHGPGVYTVEVDDPEIDSAVAEDLVTANMPGRSRPIAYEVDFQLTADPQSEAGGTITGQILGGRRGELFLLDGGQPRTTRLDQDGRFYFEDVEPDLYTIFLVPIGIIASALEVGPETISEIEFPMQGRISGEVLPAEAGQSVSLCSEQFAMARKTVTDEEGRYSFEGLPEDRYYLTLDDTDVAPQRVECGGTEEIAGPVFDREGEEQGEIGGQILDHKDVPVPDLSVRLLRLGRKLDSTTTDSDGRFQFDNLLAGNYSLELDQEGIVVTGIQIDGTSSHEEIITLEAPRNGELEVLLLDSDGQPVEERSIYLSGEVEKQERTSAQGLVQFGGLPAGEYRIQVGGFPEIEGQKRLDGMGEEKMTLQLESAVEELDVTELQHYLWITSSDPEEREAQISLTIDWIGTRFSTAGFDGSVARSAKMVTTIGEPDPEVIEELEKLQIPIHTLPNDLDSLAAELEALS